MRKTLLFAAVAVIGHCYTVSAQSTCAQTLRLAQSVYEQGRLHELPNLLENCLKDGFTDQEKVSAYKLLVLTYIYLEEPEKADQAMLSLLQTNSEFRINDAVDPAEFVALYRTFRTNPIFRMGVNIGVNATQPSVKEQIKTSSGESEYSYGIGFQVGFVGEIPLKGNFTLNPGVIFQQKNFDLTSRVSRGFDEASTRELFNTTNGKENQTWLSIPIAVQYQLREARYNPYVSLGISSDLLLGSQLTIETLQDNAGSVQERTQKVTRENLNLSAIVAGGAKMRIFGGYFTAEVRYYYGLTPVNSSDTYYKNTTISYNNNIGDSLFKLNSLSLTVGYVQNIFRPKKLKSGK